MPKEFVHGVLTPNAKPKPRRVIRSKRRIEQDTVARSLKQLLAADRPEICIVRRLGGIGDVIMTTPAVKHIKRVIPHCHLVYATDLGYAQGALGDVLKHNPYIDELIDYRTIGSRRFQLSIDLTVTGLSRERGREIPPNRIDMFAERTGVDLLDDPLPTYVITESERQWAQAKLADIGKGNDIKFIAIHARSNDVRRTWPLRYIDELIEMLEKHDDIHVLVLDWKENHKWQGKNVTPLTYMNIRRVAAIIDQCSLVLCPDSSILHLAGALECNILSIFGTTSPESRINHYSRASAMLAGLPCQVPCPCWYRPTCTKTPGATMDCFLKIKPEAVYKAIMLKLEEKSEAKKIHAMETEGMKKHAILVKRRHGGFGDIAMSLTGIEALKKAYPTADIHYALPKKYHEVVENAPLVSSIIDAGKKMSTKQYKMIIDISSCCAYYEFNRLKSKKKVEKSRVEVFSEALGVRSHLPDLLPRYYPRKEEIDWAKKFLGKTNKPRVALVLRAAEEYRNWPIENYEELAHKLRNKTQTVIIDPERIWDFNHVIDACGFSFRKAAAIVSQCSAVVTPDTSHLHIAAALGIPTVALFGPIDPNVRCKGYPKVKVVTAGLDCSPCWRSALNKCENTQRIDGYSRCMMDIPVEAVYDQLQNLL